jgi:hypothetical protein
LDWANALLALNAGSIDKVTMDKTLSVLLKHEADLQRARSKLLAPTPPPPPQQPGRRPNDLSRFSGN